MTIFPITDNVDDHIFAEFLTVLQTESDDLVDHNWIIGIHVENRSHYSFCDLCAIETRTCVSLSGREPDLVIRNYMYYSPRGVALQVLELVGFVDHTRITRGYPWPAWAASPCSTIPMFFLRCKSSSKSCKALTFP